jgi:hypothetical protein
MPQLNWNETEVLSCLAALPEIDEYEVSHSYRVRDGDLTLNLTVWQYESVAEFTLYRVGIEEPILHFALVVRDVVQYHAEKWGEWLEFRDCVIAPRRFWSTDLGNVFDRRRFPTGVAVELTARPHIQIKFTEHTSND